MKQRGFLKLKGSLSIGLTSGGDTEDMPVRIEVVDELSHSRCIEVRMSLEQFAEAVFGRGCAPCSVTFNDTGVVGMKAENKEELVPIDMYGKDPAKIQKALKPFEVEGWRARAGDITNGHRAVMHEGKRHQRVVFFRHVPAETNG